MKLLEKVFPIDGVGGQFPGQEREALTRLRMHEPEVAKLRAEAAELRRRPFWGGGRGGEGQGICF